MQVLHSIAECKHWRAAQKGSLGFVPTMGALHEGHLSLVRLSKEHCSQTLVSIFVNPAQFAPHEDFDLYPKTAKQDLKYLAGEKVDAVFIPSVNEIYKKNKEDYFFQTNLAYKLEGKSRPHFFKGVTTVVHKLFSIVNPTHAVFGKKDAQQLLIIKKMIQKKQYGIALIEAPIIRAAGGLALSSRNGYLTDQDQNIANNIYMGLKKIKGALESGEHSSRVLKLLFKNHLKTFPDLKIDYISIACTKTLDEVEGAINTAVLISAAVFLRDVRLIDNFTYFPST